MTTIKLKNGSGAPTAGDLVQGEPALDLTNKRLYTENASGTVIEVGTNPGVDVTFADNRKAVFGDSSDLQIYHDGSNSFIDDAGTGNLQIRGTQIKLQKYTGENMFVGISDGAASMYYDNAQKIATTASGVLVTGTVTADGLTTSGNILLDGSGNPTVINKTSGAGNNPLYRLQADTNYWDLQGTFSNTDDELFFMYNGSTKMAITSAGSVGIGTSTPQAKLDVSGVGNFSTAYGTFTGDGLHIQSNGTGGAGAFTGGISFSRISADNNSRAAGIAGVQGADADQVGLAFFTHPSAVTTDSLQEAMRIDANGNVGIGVVPSAWWSSAKALQIAGSTGFLNFSGANGNITTNAYYDGSNYRYLNNAGAFLYEQSAGHKWSIAAAGTTGNIATLTQAMTLDASGNLLVGTPASVGTAAVGRVQIAGTSAYVTTNSEVGGVVGVNSNADNSLAIIADPDNLRAGSHIAFYVDGLVEKARLDENGNLTLADGTMYVYSTDTANANNTILNVTKTATAASLLVNAVSLQGYSTAATAMQVGNAAGTGRSINAGGTVNASGADYAEYEHNNGLTISKGDIVGFKSDGTLTLTFGEAIRFAVKSTNPSYVGGDTWGDENQVGVQPQAPAEDAEQEVIDQYETDLAAFNAAHEAARQLVDRIAYSGKVPVNIQGANAGDYIIAASAEDGSIAGQAVSDPDFSQYKLAVGRVNRVLEDGRAEVAVIIH